MYNNSFGSTLNMALLSFKISAASQAIHDHDIIIIGCVTNDQA